MRKPTTHTQLFFFVGFRGIRPDRSVTFTLDREIVPLGEAARTFPGYPSLFHALAVASTVTNIGLVYQASFDPGISRRADPLWFGRFLVYDTGMRPFPRTTETRMAAPAENALNVRYTNLESPADTRSWAERSREVSHPARGLSASDVYPLAKRVVQDFAFLSSSEINADAAVENSTLTGEARLALFREGSVNLDLFGRLALVNGYTSPTSSEPFCEESSTAIPGAFIALSGAFGQPGPLHFLATLTHEGVHLRHFHRAAYLLEQWREIRGRRKPFPAWVEARSRSSGSRVTRFDFLTVLTFCGRGSDLIHFEPHVEAWILKVTHLPVAELEPAGSSTSWPSIEDLIRIQLERYGSSSYLEIVLEYLRPRLVRTYRSLGAERQAIVRAAVLAWPRTQAKAQPFFQWLAKIWALNSR